MAKTPSDEQRDYINASGKIVLTACPGSGKSTAVCWKVQKHLSDWTSTTQGILVLSFTNAAVKEIEKGMLDLLGHALPEPHRIMTIDSCTNAFFTLPFAQRIVASTVELRIAEDDDAINKARNWNRTEWIYKANRNTPFHRLLAPAKINYTITGELEPPPKTVTKQLQTFNAYMQAVKDWQRSRGLLTTRDSAYFALEVLRQHAIIGKAFIQRFPVVIIDEAQDSSEIQNALIDELVKAGLEHIDIVGDPNQSIYEFRGATPALFKERASQEGWTPLTFSQNRRSTQVVINAYQHLRTTDESAIVSLTEFGTDHAIVIYHYDEGEEERVVQEFKKHALGVADRGLAVVTRAHQTIADIQGTQYECEPWKAEYADPLLKAIRALSANDFAFAVRQGRKFFFLATQGLQ
jgi:DNA helicase II / ATP-dependent DNA helicase PcrA